MRTVAAMLVALLAFALSWFVIGALLALMGWAISMSGYGSDILLMLHLLLLWVVSPALGAAIGIIASSAAFKATPINTIYVSFVSICATLFVLLFIFAVFSPNQPILRTTVFAMQVIAIFLGAYLGRSIARSARREAPAIVN